MPGTRNNLLIYAAARERRKVRTLATKPRRANEQEIQSDIQHDACS